ncbi:MULTISPECIES: cytochrome c maturation protein CcmE [unclassified Methylocystis]|jgi:cytochrome c-type biogenesis protein CcmE|uniref:cytochrome c maturation protein CcmE n=1 Tax=unclassified Methylocystis TaxID=2625913 RepID=UPI0018C28AED|nr:MULTISPECIES: cytochrome c maturation protein CcmE [unclassified Methylocystis]MBG0799608.1 cytochrome c maturation protein CcmE [Methylocystis sp. L43]MBG0807391.1 cytochrome c maturation protein CcmE [Methylocystis sp. H15]MDP3554315.1 cytochrome c maturation protein CcmE [Methylocystis sp.]
MTRKGKRLTLIGGAMAILGLAAGLMLFALRDNIVFFYTPSELAKKQTASGARLRIGGLVKEGTVVKNGQDVRFTVTDKTSDLTVSYTGLLPDLFREGQGVVVDGVLQPSGGFRADSVLAKHDERYMPRDVADALKKQGVWQGETK